MKKENNTSTVSIPVKRWLYCCLLFFYTSCQNQSATNNLVLTKQDSVAAAAAIARAYINIDAVKSLVRNGDLITRTGNDFTSESLRTLNQHDKTYSHCGIASIEHDSIFVYHAIGGEFNPDQKIRRDPLHFFAEPYDNRGFGIFRYRLNYTALKNLQTRIQKLFDEGIPFDMQFDLATDDRLYCAEFVSKSYSFATANQLQFDTSKIKDFIFIGVDDLFLHSQCREIVRVVYK